MSFLSPNFLIGDIHIGSIEGASCLNMGNNLPIGFRSYKKHSQGFGSISGDNNNIEDIGSLLKDSGQVEFFDQSEDIDIPECVKELLALKLERDEKQI